jgi:malonyl CoA-acyl carrier protein transacylase
MKRALLVCPGRGSYTERAMGTLPKDHELVQPAERMRAEFELEPLLDLDHAVRFEAKRHLRPANVSALIYLISYLDAAAAAERHRIVAIAGNSMGWYTALAVSGALDFEDGFRLVQHMALLQEQHAAGGQILYPLVDEDWRAVPERRELVTGALAELEGQAFPSIQLGSFAVLAGTDDGIRALQAKLPKLTQGGTPYPLRLQQHGPYHTPLLEPVSVAARELLAGLTFRAPEATLIDGRGRRSSPWSADLEELRDYTCGAQVTTPYDLALSLRVGLREFAPERIVLPGPGNTLGGIVGHALIAEGYRGIHSKSDFQALQASDDPLVESMRR